MPFRFTQEDALTAWSNFHHTIHQRPIAHYLTPDGLSDTASLATPAPRRQAAALDDILTFCLRALPPKRLVTVGGTWSMSDVLDPLEVVLDPRAFHQVATVEPSMLTPAYRASAAPRGGVPVLVQGGTKMRDLNEVLGKAGLALQTSGANDGHRLAGCIATGTHGSALGIGAVHDTVLAVVLVTAPGQAVLLQPSQASFTPALAAWVQASTGLAVKDDPDDVRFAAAQVALGALGFVHSVVVEAVPLYELVGTVVPLAQTDPRLWAVAGRLDTSGLDARPTPYHVGVLVNPYATPSRPTGAFVTLLWKQAPTRPFAGPSAASAMVATDTSKLLSALVPVAGTLLPPPVMELILSSIIDGQYATSAVGPLFPGQAFGPTTLAPGNGRSTEVVFDLAHGVRGLTAIVEALRAQARQGRYLLGILGVRFGPKSKALLGMARAPMNMYVEVPSLGTVHTSAIQQACWQALRDAGIPFTCHWGQEHALTAAGVTAAYGADAARWVAARRALLPTAAQQQVFGSPMLTRLGLD
ncbi:MAG: hypothetical protein K1X89_00145 [Myxococcaceae bacterium]|nr:hypothetical protein [Myxococcaceae bacterium]